MRQREPTRTLRVVSYNIQEGGTGRLDPIAAVIRRQRTDVVALLEANSRSNVDRLAGDLSMELVFGEGNARAHVAWLSRLPVRRSANHRLAALAKTLLEIEVEWGGMPVRLFATHLGSRWDRPQPVDEVPAILEVLHPHAERPHLLVGDFNALRPGDPIGVPPAGARPRGDAVVGAPREAIGFLLRAGYVDCYRALHPRAAGYTYATNAPWLRLDYVFASPMMAARLARCDRVLGHPAIRASDHFPIWAEFE